MTNTTKYRLHAYQEQGIQFIQQTKRCGLFWDMGLGKTLTTLEALLRTPAMLPALIISPLRCVYNVWPSEIEKFDFPFTYSIVHSANKGKRMERLCERTQVKITNYETLEWIVDVLKSRGSVPFNTIIVDESSKVKNSKSIRMNMAQAIAEHCEYRVLLTGTPIPAGYADLWSQMWILDRGETFGTYENFINKAFYLDRFKRPVLRAGWDRKIEQAIAPKVLRGDAKELLDMPPLLETTIKLSLPLDQIQRYEEVEYGFLAGLDNLNEHTEANYAPMRCFCSGFLYHTEQSGERTTEWVHESKLDTIEEIKEGIGDKPLMVVFNFRGEREQLVSRFSCPYIDGTTKDREADSLVRQWNAGELPMLAVQPVAVGYGLNLQHGGRHMVWYSPTDCGDVYAQTVARLYRQGQSNTVHVYRLITQGTIEEMIERLLVRKILTSENLMYAIKVLRGSKI